MSSNPKGRIEKDERDSRLCDECHGVSMGWLEYRPARQVQLITIGYPKDGRTYRADRWYETVDSQLRLIREICQARHVGQLQLFEVAA